MVALPTRRCFPSQQKRENDGEDRALGGGLLSKELWTVRFDSTFTPVGKGGALEYNFWQVHISVLYLLAFGGLGVG